MQFITPWPLIASAGLHSAECQTGTGRKMLSVDHHRLWTIVDLGHGLFKGDSEGTRRSPFTRLWSEWQRS